MGMSIDQYIDKQKSPQKEILKKLRAVIRKAFPGMQEEMKWGVPNFADKFYLVALKDHVNLGMSIKGLSKDQLALLSGTGKTMRHLEFSEVKAIDEKKVVKIMKMIK